VCRKQRLRGAPLEGHTASLHLIELLLQAVGGCGGWAARAHRGRRPTCGKLTALDSACHLRHLLL
jgi:hypothetical protein